MIIIIINNNIYKNIMLVSKGLNWSSGVTGTTRIMNEAAFFLNQ